MALSLLKIARDKFYAPKVVLRLAHDSFYE